MFCFSFCLVWRKKTIHFLSGAAHSVYLDNLPAASPSAAATISVWRHLWLSGCENLKATKLHWEHLPLLILFSFSQRLNHTVALLTLPHEALMLYCQAGVGRTEGVLTGLWLGYTFHILSRCIPWTWINIKGNPAWNRCMQFRTTDSSRNRDATVSPSGSQCFSNYYHWVVAVWEHF